MRCGLRQIFLRLLLFQAFFFGGKPGYRAQVNSFQQELSYTISVQLNDTDHSLHAEEVIQYINRSDSSLSCIWMHLWPNAYKDRNSALCKQKIRQNELTLFYAKAGQRGYIDSLDFRVNGIRCSWSFHPDYHDVCKVDLPEPLKPGAQITLSTPFYVKIPSAMFSRLGHIDQAYYITQWYPKPAVFDRSGWHPMPYLDQGEFYSEYANYDVRISLPANYVLAATGDRMEAEEEELFLTRIEQETRNLIEGDNSVKHDDRFPKSDSLFKTIRFTQNRVHDFAWFADKRFMVLRDQVELPASGRVVDTWVYFLPSDVAYWKKAITYVNDAVLFYSRKLGDYPYHHASAVDGTIMAGGGMEYPNITVVNSTRNDVLLDQTITHEIGHNWFYGILGSNEREHPFMDEGLNSFYELEYMRQKYPEYTMAQAFDLPNQLSVMGLNKMPYWKEKELTAFLSLKSNFEQPLNSASEEFTAFNYGAMVYSKTALVWDYLKEYLGQERFDKAMQGYYLDFRFKHPTPEDLFNSLSAHSGTDLSAFQHYFFNRVTRVDYKVKGLKRLNDGGYRVFVKNKGEAALPFSTLAFKHGKAIASVWSNGIEKKGYIDFPPLDADYFRLDGEMKLTDFRRGNNRIQSKGFFKKRKPLRLHLITSLENEEENHLNLWLAAGYNAYNGTMLGAVFHNYSLYKKRVEYYVAPLYGFRSKDLAGLAELAWNIFPKRSFRSWSLGLRVKKFAYDHFDAESYNRTYQSNLDPLYCHYLRLKPYLEYNWKNRPVSSFRHRLEFSTTLLVTDSLTYLAPGLGARINSRASYMNRLEYRLEKSATPDPYAFGLQLWQKEDLLRLSADYKQKFSLSLTHKLELRFFAGAFLSGRNEEKAYYAFRASGYSGYQDVLFDHQFLGRNERSGVAFSQFAEEDGAMKVWTPLGQSASWLASVNLKSPKFFKLPIKLYVDAVFTSKTYLAEDALLWDAGINLSLLNSIIDVYFPLLYSNDIRETLSLNGLSYWQSIRFTLNIHTFSPGKLLNKSISQ